MTCVRTIALAVALMSGLAGTAWAGPVIIDGTDANDHGFFDGVDNQDGWLYMQKALENLAGLVDASVAKVVVNLGATNDLLDSGDSFDAIVSAFTESSLSGTWSLTSVDGAAAIDAWLDTLSTATTGILYIPTAALNPGDLTADELAAINANAAAIDSFVSGAGTPALGGALFSQGEVGTGAYRWLSTLIPGITITTFGGGGVGSALALTVDGASAFPGLTSGDLSTGPWHTSFSGSLGGLDILATAPDNAGATRNVILGGGAGTVIGCGGEGQPACPNGAVPEPTSLLLFGLGGLGAGLARRRRTLA